MGYLGYSPFLSLLVKTFSLFTLAVLKKLALRVVFQGILSFLGIFKVLKLDGDVLRLQRSWKEGWNGPIFQKERRRVMRSKASSCFCVISERRWRLRLCIGLEKRANVYVLMFLCFW